MSDLCCRLEKSKGSWSCSAYRAGGSAKLEAVIHERSFTQLTSTCLWDPNVPLMYFMFYNIRDFSLMEQIKISNVSFTASAQGSSSDLLLTHSRTRLAAGGGVNSFFPSGWDGVPTACKCKCGFFPSGHLFFSPKVLLPHLTDKM